MNPIVPSYQDLLQAEDPQLNNQERLALYAASGTRPVYVRKPAIWKSLQDKGLLDREHTLTPLGKIVFNKLNEKKEKEIR